jgi:hypothetical protein
MLISGTSPSKIQPNISDSHHTTFVCGQEIHAWGKRLAANSQKR